MDTMVRYGSGSSPTVSYAWLNPWLDLNMAVADKDQCHTAVRLVTVLCR
jgi:hypothetical protein